MKYEVKNGWKDADEALKAAVYDFANGYIDFLNSAKTERESVDEAVRLAGQVGFKPLGEAESLKAGDKLYAVNKNKGIALIVIGRRPITDGVGIVGSHIDAPRLDLKQNPLYESDEMAFLKTHYYGGIKKYQWTAIPLAIHGVVVKQSGETVKIAIGDEGDDITFTITDLLPHLGNSQMSKPAYSFIEGENLNVLVGSLPTSEGDDGKKVREAVLGLLTEKYGIDDEDFTSAELEIVPAFKAKDLGFDRSLIGAYGHDDRVCSYPNLRALLDTETPEYTAICLLTDKEEVGSMGNTGAKSRFLELALLELLDKTGAGANALNLNRALDRSLCLSADVSAAYDPNYAGVYEKSNSGRLNCGIAISKYTGSRGKSGSNDAPAELMAKVRAIFNEAGVLWHTAELGKVDEGGGGTIAQFVANLGVDTIDCGVPMLSMHAPYEVAAKMDVYQCYKAFSAFFNRK
ncbi:MAG: aminopeptidase [Oscillospiraceae bacterium]|nr:aminopeptidase [Oscillospiraceae bacterium]